jgi:hypothetical protein
VTFPDDAGIGAAAHRCAQAASERSRPGWSPRRDGQQRGGVRANPVEGEKAGGMLADEGGDELVEAAELAVEEHCAPSQLAQCDAGGVAGGAAGPGTQRRQFGDQSSWGVLGEAGSQVIGAGQDKGPGLVDRLGAFSRGAAPGDHQCADRLDRTVPAFRRAAGPAGLRGPGGADRVEGIGLALPAAVLPVGAVDLHDPDSCGGDVAGQAGAVAAGPLDPDQAHSPEPAQPVQQAGVAGQGSRELPDAEQPADRVERGGDMGVGMSVHTAGDGACLYDGQCHLFSLVEGMARTR